MQVHMLPAEIDMAIEALREWQCEASQLPNRDGLIEHLARYKIVENAIAAQHRAPDATSTTRRDET